jgi:ketosteroid isomerase-like protein
VEIREQIERIYEAWNDGDTGRFVTFFGEEAVYETSGLFPGFAPVYRGPQGMLQFYETMLEAWESFQIELLDVIEEGDAAITQLRFRARGKSSGAEVDLQFAHGARIEDGRIVFLVARESIADVRDRIGELRADGLWA